MGHRHGDLTLGARAARALAAIALGIAALSVMTTRAEAGLDPVGGDDVAQVATAAARAPDRAASRQPDERPRPDAREEPAPQRQPRPDPAIAEARNAAGDPLEVSDGACRENLAIAAKHGLLLPEGWKLYCVGPGLDWNGGTHWGVTCPYADCPEGAGPYVSISNPTYYVVAHELCHANFGNDELMADNCAAEHGASLATSPYQ